jgi:phage shock protein C
MVRAARQPDDEPMNDTAALPHPRLTRSTTDRRLFGVCGGIAEWSGLDPTLVRLAFVLLGLCGFAAVAVYLVAVLVVPEDVR